MEIWDVCDSNRLPTGRTIIRGETEFLGNYRIVVHICIFNSKGQMLIQQRQPFKEGWPGMWDITAGGSAIKGETSQMAAQRELAEEIGRSVDMSEMRPYFTVNFDHGFDDYYIIHDDSITPANCKLQESEVAQVKWAGKEEIFKMIESDEFVPYHLSIIQLLFDLYESGKMGTLTR